MIREATEEDKKIFDKAARHPLQSWAWGEFREQTGVDVWRLMDAEKEAGEVYQITWHKIPKTKFFIGYCPKSAIPDKEALEAIKKEAEKKGAVLVKFEPNERNREKEIKKIEVLKKDFSFKEGKPLFTKYTFQLDISKSEEELLKNMHQKTRYNIRLAEKRGVRIVEDNSEQGFVEYWKLTEETTKRQKFFAHTKSYHQKMWQTMIRDGSGHILKAIYEGKVLTTWVLFELNGVLYYPYGASTEKNREVMASNLMMWEAIRLGKKHGCKMFDMWGSLGPVPDSKDPWFGFHRFKQGYGGELTEFVGTYDLVVRPALYQIYTMAEKLRWIGLKLVAGIRK